MKKKKICMVTNWYPDEQNPYRGVFFKKQAFALEEHFDFNVIHYTENKKVPSLLYFFKALLKKNHVVEKVRTERNTEEYNVTVSFPMYIILVDLIYDFYIKYVKRVNKEGVGKYVSKVYLKRKKKVLQEIFKNSLAEFDVLYCVDAQVESSTLKLISDITHKPYIVSEHAPFPWPGSTIKSNEHQAIEESDLFLAISYDKVRQVLLQNIKLKKVAYVGNMVDDEQFLLRRGDNKVKTFVIVAAHSFYKNYPLFIEIFNRLVEITNIPFKVKVVGYGANKGYSKNEKHLEQLLLESKFADNLILVPEISNDRIQEVYETADAFVMTSIQEGMPVSALEAACCGLPIFSTACGGVEDYVDDRMGRIYKIIDKDNFALGLKDFLEENIVFDSEYIREQIISLFGKKVFVQNLYKEINNVIENS